MVASFLAHLRQQWIGVIALLLVLTGGTAYALDGSNTVFSDDIVNGEVKNPDLGADSVTSGKIDDAQVKNADLGPGASSSNTIADGGVRGIDVQNDSLTDADTSGLVPYGDMLWAVVGSDGTLFRASNDATTSTREGVGSGDYEVDFGDGVNVDPCASVVQVSNPFSGPGGAGPGEAASSAGETLQSSVDVRTYLSAADPSDRGFTVHVLCPEGPGGAP